MQHLLTSEYKPRFHGNGFFQWYLNDYQRVHIWHPRYPAIRDHDATIHNHRFDMHSWILCGKLEHITYDIYKVADMPAPPSEDTVIYNAYKLAGASNVKTDEGKVIDQVVLAVRNKYDFSEGSSYTHKSPGFHTSCSKDLTCTLMSKSKPSVPIDTATILYPTKAETPANAFDPKHQPSYDECLAVYKEVLG